MDMSLHVQRPLSCKAVLSEGDSFKLKPFTGFFPHGIAATAHQVSTMLIGREVLSLFFSCVECCWLYVFTVSVLWDLFQFGLVDSDDYHVGLFYEVCLTFYFCEEMYSNASTSFEQTVVL